MVMKVVWLWAMAVLVVAGGGVQSNGIKIYGNFHPHGKTAKPAIVAADILDSLTAAVRKSEEEEPLKTSTKAVEWEELQKHMSDIREAETFEGVMLDASGKTYGLGYDELDTWHVSGDHIFVLIVTMKMGDGSDAGKCSQRKVTTAASDIAFEMRGHVANLTKEGDLWQMWAALRVDEVCSVRLGAYITETGGNILLGTEKNAVLLIQHGLPTHSKCNNTAPSSVKQNVVIKDVMAKAFRRLVGSKTRKGEAREPAVTVSGTISAAALTTTSLEGYVYYNEMAVVEGPLELLVHDRLMKMIHVLKQDVERDAQSWRDWYSVEYYGTEEIISALGALWSGENNNGSSYLPNSYLLQLELKAPHCLMPNKKTNRP